MVDSLCRTIRKVSDNRVASHIETETYMPRYARTTAVMPIRARSNTVEVIWAESRYVGFDRDVGGFSLMKTARASFRDPRHICRETYILTHGGLIRYLRPLILLTRHII